MDLKADITCPNCNRTLQIPVKQMRPGTSMKCPSGCGATISFTGEDGKKVQGALDELNKTLRGFGKGH